MLPHRLVIVSWAFAPIVFALATTTGCTVNKYDQRVLVAGLDEVSVESTGRSAQIQRAAGAREADPSRPIAKNPAEPKDPEYPIDDYLKRNDPAAPARADEPTAWDLPWGDPEFDARQRDRQEQDRRQKNHRQKNHRAYGGVTRRPISDDPIFSAHLTLGGGRLDYDTDGSPFDDDDSAAFFRFRAEGLAEREFGFGISHEYTVGNDELLAAPGFDQGFRLQQHDTFIYLYAQERFPDDFRFPIRFGPYFNYLSLEDENSSDEIEWFSLGARVSIEPEFILARDDQFELSLYGDLSLGVHGTLIDSDTSVVNDEFESNGATLGIEAGLRYRFGTFSMGLAYLQRSTFFDESDAERGVFVRESEDVFRGVVLSLGLRF